ncbi:hypothetical protein MSUIS_01790 [Mycoplasma suis KI3806]|uniref:Uncharacterized protein n=1 Tax=Mycoplasma suis (strain KI_3806) TaxID=708248 RepID=F0V350_MYCS3|nr:hypothetical protein MSUIS_01790 [Mycoplasma suis KI3806]
MLLRKGLYALIPALGAIAPLSALLSQNSNLVNYLTTSFSSSGGAHMIL